MRNSTRQLHQKLLSVMSREGRHPFFSLASVLYVLSLFYGLALKLREFCYGRHIFSARKLSCNVISIGNIAAGGTGKTPMTIYVAELLKTLGYRVAILSRGYKGGSEKDTGIVSDGKKILMTPTMAGDESYMMACRLNDVPVIVGRNRFAAGCLAVERFKPNVIVLDDAFQHVKLRRDIDLVLVDRIQPFGNGHIFPRGLLREPASSLKRCDACILTRADATTNEPRSGSYERLKSILGDRPIYASFHAPYYYTVPAGNRASLEMVSALQPLKSLGDVTTGKGFGFSGIARNDDFQRTAIASGLNIKGFQEFPDHHPYTAGDLEDIYRAAKKAGADFIITTEKDYVRIIHKDPLTFDLVVIGVRISFGKSSTDFLNFIKERLQAAT